MKVIEIGKNFEEEVLKNSGKVLVDFNADWCGPCRMLRPVLDEVSENSKCKIVSVNVDSERDLALKFGISSIPCLILFDNGKEVKRSVGLISKEEVISLIGE